VTSQSDPLTTNHFPPTTAFVLPIAPARPGNAAFGDRYNFRLGHKTFFYHHGADIVPWLPGWLLGNRHVGHRVWFPDGNPDSHRDHRVWFPDLVPIPNRDRPRQSAALCREPQRVLDPSLPPLALNLAWLLCRQRARGLEALLADHHVATYEALLNPRLKAKG